MGQILSHGVYLPNEGERNCYAGLASNWQILNTAVGAIAEKAPLVHTHTVSQITDFPAYGNAAGTICEGNDSRLSDARTPLAHTHTKSDVTDLFNSANVWTGDNTFNKPIQIQKTTGDTEIEIRNQQVDVTNNTASAVDDIRFFDKNGKITGGVRLAYDSTKVSQRVYARSYSSDGTSNTNVALELKSDQQNNIKEATISSDLLPSTNNAYDLGSSSYQWKSVYAQNYYYNGTQWGLDQNNTWSGTNAFTAGNLYHIAEDPSYILKSSTMQEGVIPSGNKTAYTGYWMDKNLNILGYDRFVFYSAGLQTYEVKIRNKATNGSFDPNGSLIQSGFQLSLYPSGNSELKIYAHTLPNGNGVWNLGDSNHKWKTLNGVNPGALSLPTLNYTDTSKYIDISGGLSTTGSDNWYTPAVDGWVFIIVNNSPTFANILVFATPIGTTPARFIAGSGGVIESSTNAMWCGCPAPAGSRVRIRIKNGTIEQAVFVTCQGNV